MASKKATQVGNPVIRTKAKRVVDIDSKETRKVITDLTDSMREHGLVGMAAPQIGVASRIFVSEIRQITSRKDQEPDELRVFINPKILTVSKKQVWGWEGCGSVAESGLFAKVKRPESVTVAALNENGDDFTLKATGLLARVIQHEIDHLNGVLFIDSAAMKTCMSRSEYVKMKAA